MEIAWIHCISCGNERSKQGTRTLRVKLEDDHAWVDCYHSESCKLYSGKKISRELGQKLIDDSGGSTRKTDICPIVPAPEIDLPEIHGIRYEWRNPQGELMALTFRVERGGYKQLFPMVYTDAGWVWGWGNMKALYGAHLLEKHPKATVVVVEGEKCADTINNRKDPNYIAVAWPLGSKNVTLGEWSWLRGREIILWPDNDKDGHKAMEEVKKCLDTTNKYEEPSKKLSSSDSQEQTSTL